MSYRKIEEALINICTQLDEMNERLENIESKVDIIDYDEFTEYEFDDEDTFITVSDCVGNVTTEWPDQKLDALIQDLLSVVESDETKKSVGENVINFPKQ